MNETYFQALDWFEIYGPRIVAAMIAGAIIGLEGEMFRKPAGLRTNILLTVGSAIFTIISLYAAKTYGGEPMRVAANIIPGIGFIGAGVIIHNEKSVIGITTAVAIFTNAAVGMVVGSGLIFSGVGIAIAVFLVLVLLRPIDSWIDSNKLIQRLQLKDKGLHDYKENADGQRHD